MARLKEMYVKEVAPALMSKFSYKSTMQIPKLDKIVVNVGAGEATVRSPWFATQESPLLTSNSEKVCPSA